MVDGMTLVEALTLFQEQVSSQGRLWSYYSSAALAVLGFTIASEKATRSRAETTVIQIGFALFSLGNALTLYASQKTLTQLGEFVHSFEGACGLANTFEPWQVMLFHAGVTVSILVLIEAAFRYNKTI